MIWSFCPDLFSLNNEQFSILIEEEPPSRNLKNVLVELHFKETKETQEGPRTKLMPAGRTLQIELAGPKANRLMERRGYDLETVELLGRGRLYCYQGHAVALAPKEARIWYLAVAPHERVAPHILKTVIHRMLALHLADYSWILLWAVPSERGLVLLRPNETLGEAVLVNLDEGKVWSQDGIRKLDGGTVFLRQDRFHRGAPRAMPPEEFLSALFTSLVFLDVYGLNPKLKNALYRLARSFRGFYCSPDLVKKGKQVKEGNLDLSRGII